MTGETHNIHATAISVDGLGLAFVGPSGSGKSSLAFDCLAEAKLANIPAALISDDRVIVSLENGQVFASCPEPIRGLIELRYSGIVAVDHVDRAELSYIVLPVGADERHRLPPDDEHAELVAGLSLPVVRVPMWSRFPLSLILARIGSLAANRQFTR
ncbi:Hpr(Ser) kinase/phosphatase [Rhizobium sp. RU33A]|uniref:HPr kinase/phosphorylase n=1 Tax=Rhizobium sp. RU33A TaxID=1907413 RepID=UPI000955F89E|nr:serine kinase [Rhizobium sp. RU33A]SIQ79912.1 Hpr(Ser) kinase/phosphatase [Rhizobium sp. RU33A]